MKPYALPLTPQQIVNLERDIRAKALLADSDAVVQELVRHGMAVGASSIDFQLFHKGA